MIREVANCDFTGNYMDNKQDKGEIIPVSISAENIGGLIYEVRGQQVMIDSDLAMIYGYEVKALNQQVKRNLERFPEDFMFRLTEEEVPERLRSQNVTLNENGNKRGAHRKYLPYAFTEQGVNMLATVLKGEVAVKRSIAIMRAFKEMRHYIRQNRQFVTQNELKALTDTLGAENRELSARQDETDRQIAAIHNSINQINENFILDTELKNYVIYKGQKFEADVAYIDIYKKAKKSIYVVDDYVNIKTLHLLSHKKAGVHVILFTENKNGRNGSLTSSELTDFANEYPTIQVKPNPDCHDRFIVLDYGMSGEKVFHCGASSKDAGNKVCAINVIEDTTLIHPVIDKLLLNPDKTI